MFGLFNRKLKNQVKMLQAEVEWERKENERLRELVVSGEPDTQVIKFRERKALSRSITLLPGDMLRVRHCEGEKETTLIEGYAVDKPSEFKEVALFEIRDSIGIDFAIGGMLINEI